MKRLSKLLAIVITATCVLPFLHGIPVHAASDIKIDAAHFPDDNFRAVIATSAYDRDRNGYLSEKERNDTMNINIENAGVTSVEGIEYFPNIQGLWCVHNNISSWDLSGNKHLKGIWCSQNPFTELDFSCCPEVEWIYCFECKLESLDVSGCPELAFLECNLNPNLTSLDLSKNHKLENLFCSDCNLTSLDVSGCPLLCELDAFDNHLESLDLKENIYLKRLDVWNNPELGNIDVTMLHGLEYYSCAETGATKVDVTQCPELMFLIVSYNDYLESLDVTKNPRLCELHLDCDWSLKSLDLSNNPQLYFLQAFGLKALDKVDISNNPHLIKVYNEGTYNREPQLGDCYSYRINYGGSGEYFDNLLHIIVLDDGKTVVTTGGDPEYVPDSVIDTNDYHSGSETFATRAQAIQILYDLCGEPYVSGSSRFTDVSSSAYYADAVTWGEDNNICFGFPCIDDDTFCPNELITRQDFALMAHRVAVYKDFGSGFDYGRTDWYDDFYDIDFYAWGPYTWATQWDVILCGDDNMCYPRGRMTVEELEYGANKIFHLNGYAGYSRVVDGNGTAGGGSTYVPDLDDTSGGGSSQITPEPKGWRNVLNYWYYFSNSGKLLRGWQKINNKWYYLDPHSAEMRTGWQKINGKWYYFDSEGAMKTGWLQSGNDWYYFNSEGAMVTGWKQIGGKWYAFDNDGAMITGWYKSGSSWYYLTDDGAMKTGWLEYRGHWYYLDSNGAMKTGWTKSGSDWYYLNSDGTMKTGWCYSGGKWYYLKASGAMVTGDLKIGSKTYHFDSNGVCTNP